MLATTLTVLRNAVPCCRSIISPRSFFSITSTNANSDITPCRQTMDSRIKMTGRHHHSYSFFLQVLHKVVSKSSSSFLLKVVRTQLTHKSIAVCTIQHKYAKIITEEHAVFVIKLSVVMPCSEIVVLICLTRQQR